MSQLIRLSEENQDITTGDVIFVHGLDGDAYGAWGFDQGSGWRRWLSEDCPEATLWTLSYDAASSAWRGSTMPLTDRATNSLAVLDGHDIGLRPIVFVAHSLGGLLVKQRYGMWLLMLGSIPPSLKTPVGSSLLLHHMLGQMLLQ